jgi:hypothetical protein
LAIRDEIALAGKGRIARTYLNGEVDECNAVAVSGRIIREPLTISALPLSSAERGLI